ncbi:hypothetical protein GPECTOR_11g290 [Gonium pectorale]|uniref:Uncharacterized protein n=1 Tax=Gonium pectorale TaxID=33097 RepID=A0A150GQ35_GONPE|nr:hypothetical protein GPECTOR_11g290 [Gonium pectorale]|eukprot:KXZ51852.1 hypothetical protein GPECTOR_11g290 [Gonium pectorale]
MAETVGMGTLLWFPGIGERIAAHLPPNDVACGMRLVNKATAALLSGAEYKTVRLSEAVVPDAFAWKWGRPGATRDLTSRKRCQLITLVCRSGSLPNLELAASVAGVVLPSRAWVKAAMSGHVHICAWLRSRECPLDKDKEALEHAARYGHRQLCEWLLQEDRYPWTQTAVAAALRGGHVELAGWLLQQRPPGSGADLDANARRELLSKVMAGAAFGCDTDTLGRLHDETMKPADSAPSGGGDDGAVGTDGGDKPTAFSLLRALALRAGDEPLSEQQLGSVVAGAAGSETSDWRAKFLLAEGAPSNADAATEAARKNHLPALQALHAAGRPIDGARTLMSAAFRGHVHILAWLRDEPGLGVRLDGGVFSHAAKSGSIEAMAWLRQRGCSWHTYSWQRPSALEGAVRGGHQPSIEWLVDQGCPIQEEGESYVIAATECGGDLATLRCLTRLGIPWGWSGSVFRRSVAGGARPEALRLMIVEGLPVEWRSALGAARARGADLVAFLAALKEETAAAAAGVGTARRAALAGGGDDADAGAGATCQPGLQLRVEALEREVQLDRSGSWCLASAI